MISQTQPAAPVSPPARAAWKRSSLTLSHGAGVAIFTTGRTDPGARTIVFVHGLGHWTQAAWGTIAAEFATTHRVVAFDLPGFGDSDKPDVPYTLGFFTGVLHQIVDGLGLERFTLAGHSLGGLIAANYAALFPDRVRLLALIAPAGFLRTWKLAFLIAGGGPAMAIVPRMRPSRGFVRRTFETTVYDTSAIVAEDGERAFVLAQNPMLARAFAAVYAHAADTFIHMHAVHTRLSAFTGPALVVWGSDDKLVPVRGLDAARCVYPQAETLVIERCGHCPQIEFPALVAARMHASGA